MLPVVVTKIVRIPVFIEPALAETLLELLVQFAHLGCDITITDYTRILSSNITVETCSNLSHYSPSQPNCSQARVH